MPSSHRDFWKKAVETDEGPSRALTTVIQGDIIKFINLYEVGPIPVMGL